MSVLDNQLNWRKVYQTNPDALTVKNTPDGVTSQPVMNADPDLMMVTNTPDGETVQPVSPVIPVDVSGWTLAKRMALPTWCFGNRLMYNCRMSNIVAGSTTWTISNDPLPDPACIWALGFILWTGDHPWSYWRMGLRSTIPTSAGEMDTCQNIFPDFGNQTYAPPRINVATTSGSYYQLPIAYGLVTGGQKFVIEGMLNAAGGNLIFNAYLIVSGLPTSIPAFLNPDIP